MFASNENEAVNYLYISHEPISVQYFSNKGRRQTGFTHAVKLALPTPSNWFYPRRQTGFIHAVRLVSG